MEALALLIMGISNIACFVIGAKVGQTVQQGKKIELPTVSPIRRNKEPQEHDKYATILRNIENYDGSSLGQEEVI